ncbi:type II toxin-antitoxin system VapB family antitoxin [Bdellovibrionota bacterium FG-1]
MKRTNLVLDEELLKTATQVLGAKTYSAAVNQALAEAIRTAKIRGLAEFFGTGVWEGELSEMREDHPVSRSRPRRKS